MIDDKAYEVANTAVLYDADEKLVAAGKTNVLAALTVNDEIEKFVEKDGVISSITAKTLQNKDAAEALAAAVKAAKAAQEAHLAAGGEETDEEYAAVPTELEKETLVLADIEKATAALEKATEALENKAIEELKQKLNNLTVNVTKREPEDPPVPKTDKGGIRVSIGWSSLGEYADQDAWDVLESLEVTLYKNNEKLVTNVLTDRYDGPLKNATPSPFNFGSEGNTQYAWDRGAYELDVLDNPIMPDAVVVEFVIDGETYTIKKAVNL